MKTLRIGGVPEHFNLPWMRLLARGTADAVGVEAVWEDFPGGTGAMRDALAEGRLDLAMLLTEGAVAAIAAGAPFRILSCYTESPLLWGVHVPAASKFTGPEQLEGARIAISRFGSGSHLMAYVLAEQRGWRPDTLRFVAVGDLEGAVRAFEHGRADVFLWEKFMTKPLVDAGRFRRVAEFSAPWPAFVCCAADAALARSKAPLLRLIEAALESARELAADPGAPAAIAARYGLLEADAAAWLATTRWARAIEVDGAAFDRAAAVLVRAGLSGS